MSEEEDVTEEQRARISSKFRAAKDLLSRKRPPLSPLPHLLRRSDIAHSPALLSCVQRPPLSDISTNTAFFQESITKPSTILTRIQEAPFDGAPVKDSCDLRRSITSPEQTGKFLTKESFFPSGSVIPDDELDSVLLEEVNLLCQLKYLEQRVGDDLDSGVKDDKESPADGRSCSSSIPTIRVTEYRGNSDDDMGLASSFQEIIASRTIIEGDMPEAYSRYLQKLNEKQLEAACSEISIPSMIIAGPGSGKTSTMVGRILVQLGKGIRASNILAMTFTTAAACEMKDRISTVAGKEVAKELNVSTFHSFSLQLCRSHAEKLERTSEFLIYGHGHQRRAVVEAMRLFEKENSKQIHDHPKLEGLDDLNLPHLKDKSKKWQNFVSQAKASGKTPQDFSKVGDHTRAAILKNYEDILKSCNALDYHDLISCSVNLLSNFPQVRKESQDFWKAIIIDEFQDTSSMQYRLLRSLASHNCITVVGDEDQSIFGFSGANISGFNSFRKDFPNHKEVRLVKNYRSTRCIVEAASSLIQKNTRHQFKNVLTDNASGSKITIKECRNEDAQCTFVIDKILETLSNNSDAKSSFGDIAILYRRQVSGKVFQSAFRDRNIPFNVHGVAFYRKKVVRAIISMLKTTLPGCDDGPYRRVFKVLLSLDKEEKEKVIGHVDKISAIRRCGFLSAASDIFVAKLSGTLKRSQLTSGRMVLSTLDMISKLVSREQSLSTVISSVANMVPQKYLLEQRAIVDFDGGKLLNEDSDLRTVLHYLLDDVSNFLSTKFVTIECSGNAKGQQEGCRNILKAFIDFISAREAENFRSRRDDNRNSVALTTIHQSKGLEWDSVFILKVNESEIPLLHEHNGAAEEIATLVEEERRLLYVAMTRARKKLFILYVTMDSSWQMLQPSRFLKEIPVHLIDFLVSNKVESPANNLKVKHNLSQDGAFQLDVDQMERKNSEAEKLRDEMHCHPNDIDLNRSIDVADTFDGNSFLKRFRVNERSVVSHLFHQWAKKPAFKDPKRLLDKVGFVIDERLRVNKNKHKDVLSVLKTCLSSNDALQYAQHVLKWEQMPADQRAHLMMEKQEHFQKLRIEKSMGSAAPTLKQISYLQKLGCTAAPSSRLHASKLIEQYKSL